MDKQQRDENTARMIVDMLRENESSQNTSPPIPETIEEIEAELEKMGWGIEIFDDEIWLTPIKHVRNFKIGQASVIEVAQAAYRWALEQGK